MNEMYRSEKLKLSFFKKNEKNYFYTEQTSYCNNKNFFKTN